MSGPRILIAGIGNIFLGDDAFGVEVARRLSWRAWPDGYGSRFRHPRFRPCLRLTGRLRRRDPGGCAPRRRDPGTVYTIELGMRRRKRTGKPNRPMETHGMNPMRVLEMVHALGGQPKRVLVVGCEPETFGDQEEGALGLSAAVEAAVDVAIGVIDRLVAKIGCEHRAGVPA